MMKSQIISLFAAAAFAVAVPSAAFALDADACGDQVADALEQKTVDSANSADWFEEGAPLATSAAAPSQEPVGVSQANLPASWRQTKRPRAILASKANSPRIARGGTLLAPTGISCAMERSSRAGNTSTATGTGSIPRRAAKWLRVG